MKPKSILIAIPAAALLAGVVAYSSMTLFSPFEGELVSVLAERDEPGKEARRRKPKPVPPHLEATVAALTQRQAEQDPSTVSRTTESTYALIASIDAALEGSVPAVRADVSQERAGPAESELQRRVAALHARLSELNR